MPQVNPAIDANNCMLLQALDESGVNSDTKGGKLKEDEDNDSGQTVQCVQQ